MIDEMLCLVIFVSLTMRTLETEVLPGHNAVLPAGHAGPAAGGL